MKRSSVPCVKISAPTLVVVGENSHHFLGLARLGERCETPQIGEEDDDLAAMALQEASVADDPDPPAAVTGNDVTGWRAPIGDLPADTRLRARCSIRPARPPADGWCPDSA